MFLGTIGGAILALISPVAALAEYPERAIEFIVPSSPGGGSDTAARVFSEFFARHLGGASIAVINHGGGGGALGISLAAQAAPDGYTLGQLQSPQVVSKQFENENARFSADSFEYIGIVTSDAQAVAVLNDSPIETWADLMAASADGNVNCAVTGNGGGPQLATLRMIERGGPAVNLINFDGGSEARAALLGGHVDALCINIGGMLRAIDEIRVLGVASNERLPEIPDTPTFREHGVDLVAGTDRILAVPAGTPDDIVAALRAAYDATMADPDFLASAQERGLQLGPLSGEAVEAALRAEEESYRDMWARAPWVRDQ
jgi:tripartite-type tricarboxylate transporter receptor subunit TctC